MSRKVLFLTQLLCVLTSLPRAVNKTAATTMTCIIPAASTGCGGGGGGGGGGGSGLCVHEIPSLQVCFGVVVASLRCAHLP